MTGVVHSWSMKNVFPPFSVVEIVTIGIAVKAIYWDWINQLATISLNTNQIKTLLEWQLKTIMNIHIRDLHQEYFQLWDFCKHIITLYNIIFLFLLSQMVWRKLNYFSSKKHTTSIGDYRCSNWLIMYIQNIQWLQSTTKCP